jgi:hypothetical protein
LRAVLVVPTARVRAAESSCSPWAQFRTRYSTPGPPSPIRQGFIVLSRSLPDNLGHAPRRSARPLIGQQVVTPPQSRNSGRDSAGRRLYNRRLVRLDRQNRRDRRPSESGAFGQSAT